MALFRRKADRIIDRAHSNIAGAEMLLRGLPMFDSNAMQELAHLSRQRYERAGGGGTHTVYASSRTYDEAHGYKEMSSWDQLVYRTNMLWRSESRSAISGFRWDCHALTLDRDANGDIPF